jgi:VanZ family protein
MSTKTILARILFVVYLAAIAFLCFMHADRIPDMQKTLFGIPTDKVAHFLMFLPFPILTFLAFDHVTNKVWSAVLFAVLTFAVGAAIAWGTEYIQGMLPYRSRDVTDFRADLLALGISTLGVFITDLVNLPKRN